MESSATDSTVNGTAVHAAAEHGLNEKLDGRTTSLDELIGVYDRELTALLTEPMKWTKYKNAGAIQKDGRKQVGAWLDEVEPQVQPALVEPFMARTIVADAERSISMEGTPDCIDADGVVWDWKTGTRQYREWEYQRQAIQPTVYSFLAQWHLPPPWRFRYAILRPNGTVDYCSVTRSPSDHRWLMQKVINLAITLEAELPAWPVNDQGWWCSEKWCPAWSTCKGA